MNTREKIFSSIYDIVENNIFLNDVLLKYAFNEDNDKAFVKRSVSGVLENKILIDFIIGKYSKTKHDKLDKKVYIVLLCAIYELLFMNSSKRYAVINEYVEIIKKQKTQFHANFTNAVLRNISRNENIDSLLDDKNIDATIKYSIPRDLYKYLKANINIDTDNIDKKIEEIFKYYHENNYISFRINKYDDETIDTIQQELTDKNIDYFIYDKSCKLTKLKCLMARNISSISSLDCFNKGLISVQDISSIYYIDKLYDIAKFILPKDIRVLDACASPGGKSLAFLTAFDEFNIDIYSCDKTENKLTKIKENFERLKPYLITKNINIQTNDATTLNDDYINSFDIVMIDVPCSGLGIISKKQDIKYNFDINKTKDLITIQKKILDINKQYVKKDGYLCYSTCTITKNENDELISDFIKDNTNFEIVYKEQILSSQDNMSDGFYFCIMKRLS